VLRFVARRRLVKIGNPSPCAAVIGKCGNQRLRSIQVWLRELVSKALKIQSSELGPVIFVTRTFLHVTMFWTNFMELNPSWGAANCAVTQKLPSILWNPKDHYRVHKSHPLVSSLSQIDSVHTTPILSLSDPYSPAGSVPPLSHLTRTPSNLNIRRKTGNINTRRV
jgi:hypothetical protein